MANPNHGRRAVRNAINQGLLTASKTDQSVLPAPLVKDDKRAQPKAGAIEKRLAIMPENTDIHQEYLGNENDENHHTIIIEWSVFVAAGLAPEIREETYETGINEIAAVLTADPGFNGSCAYSKPVRLEEVDEDYGGAGALSAGFIFMRILLDSASVLS